MLVARTKEAPSRVTLVNNSKTETWYLWLLERWRAGTMTGSFRELGDGALVQTQNLRYDCSHEATYSTLDPQLNGQEKVFIKLN